MAFAMRAKQPKESVSITLTFIELKNILKCYSMTLLIEFRCCKRWAKDQKGRSHLLQSLLYYSHIENRFHFHRPFTRRLFANLQNPRIVILIFHQTMNATILQFSSSSHRIKTEFKAQTKQLFNTAHNLGIPIVYKQFQIKSQITNSIFREGGKPPDEWQHFLSLFLCLSMFYGTFGICTISLFSPVSSSSSILLLSSSN